MKGITLDNPLLSIVIPTRNRPDCLQFSVKSALTSFSSMNVEIIIVSNGDSETSDTKYLSSDQLDRVKLVRSEQRLSMSENWRFGYKFCTGEWINYHGDDDLFLPIPSDYLGELLLKTNCNGIKFLNYNHQWIENNPETLKSSVDYAIEKNIKSGPYKTKLVSIEKKIDWWNIIPRDLPSGAASSFIKKSWLEKINNDNVLFNSVSPDWYHAAIFALIEKNYIFVNLPLVSIGSHPRSSIAQMKDKKLFDKEVTNLSARGSTELFNKIGNYFPTTWRARIDALIQAKKYVDGTLQINFEPLVKNSYQTTPMYVIKVYILQRRNFPEYKKKHLYWCVSNFIKSLFTLFTNKINCQLRINKRSKVNIIK